MANNSNNKKDIFKILEELRRRNKGAHFTRANLWNQEVNKTERGLSNLFFTLATFLFVFTSPIFQQSNQFNDIEKTILSISWVILFFSVIFGLLQIVSDIKYFFEASERESRGEKFWSETITTFEKYEETSEKAKELYLDFRPHNVFTSVAVQAVFLIFSFGLILYVAVSALF